MHSIPTAPLYLADTTNHRIRRITTNGIIDTFAGTGLSGYAGDVSRPPVR